jgi:protease I
MAQLTDLRVAVLATDGFEEPELTEPVKALKEAGAGVTIVSPRPGDIQGVRHDLDKTLTIKVDRMVKEVNAERSTRRGQRGGV